MKLIFLFLLMPVLAYAEELTPEKCEQSDSDIVAQCIEKGIWDPCNFGATSGSYRDAQCSDASKIVAEHNLNKTRDAIKSLLSVNKTENDMLVQFIELEEVWEKYRARFCNFSELTSQQTCLREMELEHNKTLTELLYNIKNTNEKIK